MMKFFILLFFIILFTVKTCAAPDIANAKIVGKQRSKYNINSRIQYKCDPGFNPEQPVHITCNAQTEWTGILQCTGMLVTYDTITFFLLILLVKWRNVIIIYYKEECIPDLLNIESHF